MLFLLGSDTVKIVSNSQTYRCNILFLFLWHKKWKLRKYVCPEILYTAQHNIFHLHYTYSSQRENIVYFIVWILVIERTISSQAIFNLDLRSVVCKRMWAGIFHIFAYCDSWKKEQWWNNVWQAKPEGTQTDLIFSVPSTNSNLP